MTKTNNLRHRVPLFRRPLVIVAMLIAIVLIAILVVVVVKAISPSQTDNSADSSSTDSTESVFKESEVDTPGYEEATEIGDEKKIPQYEAENPNTLENLTGSVVYTDADAQSGTITTMVSIDQYLYNGGTCELKVKSGDDVLATASSPIIADVTTSHCGPITATIPQLSGAYELEITLSADNKTGLVTTNINF